MKYTREIVDRLVQDYQAGSSAEKLAQTLQVPTRSVIAKLSSLGVYQRKAYTNKRGEPPRKKSEIIEKLANLLELDLELCESMEKCNKLVLEAIERKLDPKLEQAATNQQDPL